MPKTGYVRLEAAGVAVSRCTKSVRNAVRCGVPAVVDGRVLLVDLAALRKHFAPRRLSPDRDRQAASKV
jgi:hypothetical protein